MHYGWAAPPRKPVLYHRVPATPIPSKRLDFARPHNCAAGIFLFGAHMAKVNTVADMQAGDYMQLPTGIWHLNTAAQALYAEAQQIMRDNAASDPRPQYQVTNEPGNNARLERIR